MNETRRNILRTASGLAAALVGASTVIAQEEEYPEWESTAIYDIGDRVVHDGYVWEAQWPSMGEEPGNAQVWEQIRPVDGDGDEDEDDGVDSDYPAWDATAIYDIGDRVVHAGYVWEAQWPSMGEEPGDAQVWEEIGTVDDGDEDDGDDDPAELEAVLEADATMVEPGERIDLDASASEGDVETYEWDFDDGTSFETEDGDISYGYQEPGEYTVTVTVVGADGNTDSASVEITVDDGDGDDEPVHDDMVMAYYPGWGPQSTPEYHPEDVPLEKITDVLYAFLDVREDGTVELVQDNASVHESNLETFADLAADHPDTRFHLSVGGWTLSDNFSEAAATQDGRERFAETAIDLVREYDFDGIDIDWEFPGQGGADGRDDDPENHVALLEECREQLDAAGDEDDRHYYLSIAASASPWSAGDLRHQEIADVCDHILVMSYDMTGTWADQTGFNAPLFDAPDNGTGLSVSGGLANWTDDWGVSEDQLVVGLPFYGRGFANVPTQDDGLAQSFDGVPDASNAGGFDFTDLEENYETDSNYEKHWHEESMVPWLYSEDEEVFISYDDAESIGHKADYATENDFSGVMIWEISQDRNETLLDSVLEGMGKGVDDGNGDEDDGNEDGDNGGEEPAGPTAAISASRTTVELGQPVDFDASASEGAIVEYTWDLGDGTVAEDAGPEFTYGYQDPGEYTVTVTVTDDEGRTDSASLTLTAEVPVATH